MLRQGRSPAEHLKRAELSSLKEMNDDLADSRLAPEEATSPVDEELHELHRTGEEKTRKCLICKTPFPSAWAGERVCRRCKATSTWRSTGLD